MEVIFNAAANGKLTHFNTLASLISVLNYLFLYFKKHNIYCWPKVYKIHGIESRNKNQLSKARLAMKNIQRSRSRNETLKVLKIN